jgi:hypothetical protein
MRGILFIVKGMRDQGKDSIGQLSIVTHTCMQDLLRNVANIDRIDLQLERIVLKQKKKKVTTNGWIYSKEECCVWSVSSIHFRCILVVVLAFLVIELISFFSC